MTLTALSLLAALGAAVGLLGSVFGLGGGIFIVPVLVLYFKLPIHSAIAASLVTIIATSSAVASVNVERGLANMRLGLSLEVSTAAGAVAGAFTAGALSPKILQFCFSLLLFFAAAAMFRKGIAKPAPESSGEPPPGGDYEYTDPATGRVCRYAVKNLPAASAVSVFAGAVSGLLGVGGGIIKVPLMHLVCGIPIKAAAATSNFMLGVTAATSAVVYFRKGLVPLELTAVLVLGVLAGSAAGMRILAKTSSNRLQLVFSLIAFLMAAKILSAAWDL
ncbi:MAG: sulfite exporter TauE/SafE family protein [Elusimicrobiaceae bacterium]|nr:sulfite exporter TauE/SafE family protein [Elusimicrobiaceae bacterium]